MREITVGIVDSRREYAERLAAYLSLEADAGLYIRCFTEPGTARKALEAEPADVLLIGEDVYEESDAGLAGTVFLLTQTEGPGPAGEAERTTGGDRAGDTGTGPAGGPDTDLNISSGPLPVRWYRFRPAGQLAREIRLKAGEKEEKAGRTRCLVVTGAAGRCGKTAFSAAVAQEMSRADRVLLWTLDPVSGWTLFSGDSRERAASLYFLYRRDELTPEAVRESVRVTAGPDVLPQAQSLPAWRDLYRDDVLLFLKEIGRVGGYAWVVLDAGREALTRPEAFLPAEEIVLVSPAAPETGIRQRELKDRLERAGREAAAGKRHIREITVPVFEAVRRGEEVLEDLAASPMGRAASQLAAKLL